MAGVRLWAYLDVRLVEVGEGARRPSDRQHGVCLTKTQSFLRRTVSARSCRNRHRSTADSMAGSMADNMADSTGPVLDRIL
ncbi:hypothetical protein EVAR_18673_1 [Eumeta japonica]|uniref:Uncharacterized protein n=1 Tax=Eumeta variegata TaxID=151549 RepID=A0A4C1U6N2_EUMVA|nr:hypothetical protein EVAR_18673_1 [Eumeta japonica]